MSQPVSEVTGPRRARHWRLAVGLGLLAWVLEATALSSGAPRGTPLIGRPLQMTVPVTWNRGEAPPCVRAEFLQGESPGGPLRWRLDQVSDGSGLLRLFSTLPVQEPAITVQLSLGCSQQFSREYVLLAEPPNAVREAQVAAETPELPVALAPLPLSAATTLSSLPRTETPPPAAADSTAAAPPTPPVRRSARGQDAGRPRARTSPATNTAPARREPARREAAARGEAPPAAARPRLKLEPIDIAIDEAPVLRLTSALATPPAAAVAPAARAAAQGLAQALNTSPEQQAAQALAAKAVETELRAMRELVQRYGAESRAIAQRLEQVSSERDLVINILAALVVLLGTGFGYLLWQRSRESGARRVWWDHAKEAEPATQPPPGGTAAVAATAAGGRSAEVEDLGEPVEQLVPTESTSAFDLFDLPDFTDLDQTRMPSVAELLGLQERVDFFLAAEQPQKAAMLLEAQLHHNAGGSPYIWLELLALCRSLGHAEEHERLRMAFQKQFSVRMPAFNERPMVSEGLEEHPSVLARVTSLWRLPRVLQVIEDSLFLDPRPGSVAFDLEASRDLLFLYVLATELQSQPAASERSEEPFPATMHAPLMALSERPAAPVAPPAAAPEPQDPPAQAAAAPAPRELEVLQWEEAPSSEDLPKLDVPGVADPAGAAQPPTPVGSPDIDLEQMQSLLPDDLDFVAPPAQRAGR